MGDARIRLGRPVRLEALLELARGLNEDLGAELVAIDGGFPPGTARFRVPVPPRARLNGVRRTRLGTVIGRRAAGRIERATERLVAAQRTCVALAEIRGRQDRIRTASAELRTGSLQGQR
jgi:hypothetical protein